MDNRERHEGRDREPWNLGRRQDENQDYRSDRREERHFGQRDQGYRNQDSRSQDFRSDANEGFGESGGYGVEWSEDRLGAGQGDRGQVNFGGSGPSNQYGQTYGRGGGNDWRQDYGQGGYGAQSHGQSYGQHQGGRDDDRHEGRRQTEQRRFGQSGQAGFGESDYAHGLSQSSGYGTSALGVGRSDAWGQTSGYGQGYRTSDHDRGRIGGDWAGDRSEGARSDEGSSYGQSGGRYAGAGADRFGQRDQGGRYRRGRGGRGGEAPGFGQGGAYQTGYGGQSDRQMRDEDRGEHRGDQERGFFSRDRDHDEHRAGGTYAQSDWSGGARRSDYRDEQRYSGGMHQNQGGYTGFSGYGSANRDEDDHEPDYKHWKSSQLADMDREHHEKRNKHESDWDKDYKSFREHKRTKFGHEFEDWRKQNSAQNATSTTGDAGGSSGSNATGSGLSGGATDTTSGGGAGLRGAGAAGGSSATMASGSASAGADQSNVGASTAGVTTGSEDKAKH